MYQIQMQMLTHDTRTSHFVIWTPNFCFPVIVEFDDNFLDQIEIPRKFFRKHMAHELFTRNLEFSVTLTYSYSISRSP